MALTSLLGAKCIFSSLTPLIARHSIKLLEQFCWFIYSECTANLDNAVPSLLGQSAAWQPDGGNVWRWIWISEWPSVQVRQGAFLSCPMERNPRNRSASKPHSDAIQIEPCFSGHVWSQYKMRVPVLRALLIQWYYQFRPCLYLYFKKIIIWILPALWLYLSRWVVMLIKPMFPPCYMDELL